MRPPLRRAGARTRWYWLLLLPFVCMLWPALYARVDPTVAGIPFFYWYQFAWVVLSALLTALVYRLSRD